MFSQFLAIFFRTIFSDQKKNDANLSSECPGSPLASFSHKLIPSELRDSLRKFTLYVVCKLCLRYSWLFGVANLIGKSIVASALLSNVGQDELRSGKHTKNYGKSPFLWENSVFLWPFSIAILT